MMTTHEVTCRVGRDPIVFQTGRMARQADGAVFVTSGKSAVIVTAVASKNRSSMSFLPLVVDYRERTYAAGKIPGGFFKREGRPTDKETLTCRLIDRPVRPLLDQGIRNEIQVIAIAIAADQENDTDILAMNGAFAALHISRIPWAGPLGAVRIGRLDGEWIINPTHEQRDRGELDMVVAGSRDGIAMVEGATTGLTEEEVIEALTVAHEAIQTVLDAMDELRAKAGVDKVTFELEPTLPQEIFEKANELVGSEVQAAVLIGDKPGRREALQRAYDHLVEALGDVDESDLPLYKRAVDEVFRHQARTMTVEAGIRVGGRDLRTVRPLDIEVGLLPRVHGTALFTRGDTQAFATVTLGTAEDEQRVDDISGETTKRFMLHYNFPPFCVGETRMMRGPGRREIGHGYLAERALTAVLPDPDDFPYTIRLVSDILESDGSSSMATVCGGSLAMMDAGVPIREAVAGVAMGLIQEGDKIAILTDILGTEDHLGDMDFKVAGTADGITAIQMDIKIKGVSKALLRDALGQAREARLHILSRMNEVISASRPHLSPYAPRIVSMKIDPDKIRDIIGPGGKVIRQIVAETGAKINVEDDGTVRIYSSDQASLEAAEAWIQRLTESPEVGKTYLGKVRRVESYGAFVEILPGTDGLLHISQIAEYRVKDVRDEMREGDEILVKLIAVDPQGRLKLSRKAVLAEGTNGGGQRNPARA